jgi:hypothetical protein
MMSDLEREELRRSWLIIVCVCVHLQAINKKLKKLKNKKVEVGNKTSGPWHIFNFLFCDVERKKHKKSDRLCFRN